MKRDVLQCVDEGHAWMVVHEDPCPEEDFARRERICQRCDTLKIEKLWEDGDTSRYYKYSERFLMREEIGKRELRQRVYDRIKARKRAMVISRG